MGHWRTPKAFTGLLLPLRFAGDDAGSLLQEKGVIHMAQEPARATALRLSKRFYYEEMAGVLVFLRSDGCAGVMLLITSHQLILWLHPTVLKHNIKAVLVLPQHQIPLRQVTLVQMVEMILVPTAQIARISPTLQQNSKQHQS